MASAQQIIDGDGGRRDTALPSERAFAGVVAVVLAAVAVWPLTGGGAPRPWLLAVAGGVAVLGLFRPAMLRPANRLWCRLGLLLHRVMSPLVFGILYFAVLTPMAVATRLAGNRPLALRPDPEAASYWIARPSEQPAAESMKRQF